ncbi:MAG: patatin-like phospholipase family protein [Rhodoferax sp.]
MRWRKDGGGMCYVQTMTEAQKYQRCMVMGGGGFRYGIYLGMYAAACEVGQCPDLVLATCGASLAAALIRTVPDDAGRRAWMASPEMYAYCCGFRSVAPLHRTLWQLVCRALQQAPAPRIPDLFGEYLFEPSLELPAFSPPLSPMETDVAIIGSRLLFGPQDAGQTRGQRKLFEETVFCSPRVAQLLQGLPSPFAHARWGNTAVAATLATDTDMPLAQAVRISVSDMYYFPVYAYGGACYMGGVVDLFPIELAQRLAHEIAIEHKPGFAQLTAAPAWRAVLGVNANQRRRHVHAQRADVWIDTSDIGAALPTQGLRKTIGWRKNRVGLSAAPSYAEFAHNVQAQWDYGYQRAMQAYGRRLRPTRTGLWGSSGHHKETV